MHIPLSSFYLLDGTPLGKFVDGALATPGVHADGSIRWNNHAAPTAIAATIVCPRGNYVGCLVELLAGKSGATLADAATFDVGIYRRDQGDAYDAGADIGGTTGAMDGAATAKTLQRVTLTTNWDNDLTESTRALLVTIKPTAGTLETDGVSLFRVQLTPGHPPALRVFA
ncbi:MAG: hypothetical protein IT424_07035 [Pirellulales bacterium]|nr:hypothetical protein [Pirellulales bacterium]